MKITAEIFEAHLKCHTKCWLRTINEPFSGNAYSEWLETRKSLYRESQTKQLITGLSYHEIALSPTTHNFDIGKWSAAVNVKVEEQLNNYILETELHAIERVTSKNKDHPEEFIPIRFNFKNKLGKDDKLLLAFDAFVLTVLQRRETQIGKIIHGDYSSAIRIKVSALFEKVKYRIDIIAELLSSPSPPELILNRHCSECEFQNRCRQVAKEFDDLSLLSGLSEKERDRHRNKGIFTVNQLSYTFRPRRAPKRAKNPNKPHYFSLQALAIRENCVYIHGSPSIPECKSKVYLDIEGLPDNDFYYLIGALVVSEDIETFYSFWADSKSDSTGIFLQLIEVISELSDYRVFHYGDYDAAAIKSITAFLPKNQQEQINKILNNCVNVLSLIYPHVYFPTFSNSLKEIAPILGVNVGQEATGLDSIIWRMQWEIDKDSRLKSRLLEYNLSDCLALQKLTNFLFSRITKEVGDNQFEIKVNSIDEMHMPRPRWQLFSSKPNALVEFQNVIKSAYFDYQREKVLIRTHPQFKAINQRATKNRTQPSKPDKTSYDYAERCPNCRNKKLTCESGSEIDRTEVDLKYSKSGVKKCVTRIVSLRYKCEKCGNKFRSEKIVPPPHRYGHGFVSWCVYQNIVLGVSMGKVRKGLVELFGLHIHSSTLHRTKARIATFYEELYSEILEGILISPVLHIDETTVKLQKSIGYVWVLTSMDRVYYLYRPTREAEFLHEMLARFRGVLISDFFTGYDSIPCEQQKCLIHLVRDIDDDLLRNPFDEELKGLVQPFGKIIASIIVSIDQFGLRKKHLKKHKKSVDIFMKGLEKVEFTSDLANKYAKRIKKYGSKMFTFLDYDGVPWNNNNAEHAIKRFAKYRRENDGKFTEATLKDYLVIASVFETCEFNNINVLRFLLSKEQTLDELLRLSGRRTSDSESTKTSLNR